ncbi:MAG TPA: ferredoxin, partial [Blastocatellia bacterium]|nr:ferredoxin [Blastocatellia bacterium]
MALIELRRAENVGGDFFVDSSCIDCDLCRQIAPATFKAAGDQSVVYQQPRTP